MHLGTLTLTDKIPTEAGFYFWVNDVLCPNGEFVKVTETETYQGIKTGEFYYVCQREYVNVKTFKRSRWSEKLTFDLSIW